MYVYGVSDEQAKTCYNFNHTLLNEGVRCQCSYQDFLKG